MKKFKSEPSVKEVQVDLEKKVVKLQTKDEMDITDEAIQKDITDAGFNVVSITRE